MGQELLSEASDLVVSAIDKAAGNYQQATKHIKEAMDRKFGPTWNCIIGRVVQ